MNIRDYQFRTERYKINIWQNSTLSQEFEELALKLPDLFPAGGELINSNSRNTIKAFAKLPNLADFKGKITVKKFGQRGLYDNLRFRLARSRARRSLLTASRIKAAGLQVPKPLAAFEYRVRGNKLAASFYLYKYFPADFNLYSLYDDILDSSTTEKLLIKLAREIKTMHDAGIFHADLHPKNILFKAREKKGVFALFYLDFNRAKNFSSLSTARRARDLYRLRLPAKHRELFLSNYDREKKEELKELMDKYYKWHQRRKSLKNWLKG